MAEPGVELLVMGLVAAAGACVRLYGWIDGWMDVWVGGCVFMYRVCLRVSTYPTIGDTKTLTHRHTNQI